eukprot:1639406-Alexandrium_andersonii.AAC.1
MVTPSSKSDGCQSGPRPHSSSQTPKELSSQSMYSGAALAWPPAWASRPPPSWAPAWAFRPGGRPRRADSRPSASPSARARCPTPRR